MSRLKAEVKVGTAHNIGVAIEDALEAAQASESAAKGGKAAIAQAKKAMAAIMVQTKKEALEDEDFPQEALNVVSKMMNRIDAALTGVHSQMQAMELQSVGEKIGLEKAVKIVSKVKDSELNKLKGYDEAEAETGAALAEAEAENGERQAPGRRAVGVHPGRSLREQREAEAQSDEQPSDGSDKPAEAEQAPKLRRRRPQPKDVNDAENT